MLMYNGKPYNGDEFMRDMKKKIMEAGENGVKNRIASLVCPTHGKRPVVMGSEHGGDRMNIKYSCCCEQLEQMIRTSFGAKP